MNARPETLPAFRRIKDFTVPNHVAAANTETEGRTILTIPWASAVDVWVSNILDANTALQNTVWKLFAVTGTSRVLVARNVVIGRGGSSLAAPARGEYILGARNIACDNFDVVCEPSTLFITPTTTSTIMVDGFDGPGGPATGIPAWTNTNAIQTDPLRPLGGAGTWGTGAIAVGNAFANNRLLVNQTPTAPLCLVELTGHMNNAALSWLYVVDAGVFPADGYVPNGVGFESDYVIQLLPNADFSWKPEGGQMFKAGVAAVVSSTQTTLTKRLAPNDTYIHARWYP